MLQLLIISQYCIVLISIWTISVIQVKLFTYVYVSVIKTFVNNTIFIDDKSFKWTLESVSQALFITTGDIYTTIWTQKKRHKMWKGCFITRLGDVQKIKSMHGILNGFSLLEVVGTNPNIVARYVIIQSEMWHFWKTPIQCWLHKMFPRVFNSYLDFS